MIRWFMAAAIATVFPVAAQAVDLQGQVKEGLYDINVDVEASGIEGMPGGMKMPGISAQKCISAQDINDAGGAILMQQGPMGQLPKDCALLDFKLNGNTATYRMTCTGANRMSMDGSITFAGGGYQGINNVSIAQGKGQMNMKMSFNGRYLGPCKTQ